MTTRGPANLRAAAIAFAVVGLALAGCSSGGGGSQAAPTTTTTTPAAGAEATARAFFLARYTFDYHAMDPLRDKVLSLSSSTYQATFLSSYSALYAAAHDGHVISTATITSVAPVQVQGDTATTTVTGTQTTTNDGRDPKTKTIDIALTIVQRTTGWLVEDAKP